MNSFKASSHPNPLKVTHRTPAQASDKDESGGKPLSKNEEILYYKAQVEALYNVIKIIKIKQD